ncbi:arginine deiminase [Actinotalea sp. K2]|uniref:arginine deiminase n=1 Tax=Actinotalea sp. K2 TaxID=2939438 RepID=UPI0020183000|nr:arginine deiminase [Actinotalea sp. K2]MCL3862873.1 arginine deiminase [Actinotalea sp. K2]
MTPAPYGVHSEVGALRSVIVHRPDLSLERLTPSNHHELLFDDVLWVEHARKEHDAFVELLRGRGIEVHEHQQLLAEALEADPRAKQDAVERTVSHLTVGPVMVDDVRAELASWDGVRLARHLIGGLTKEELGSARGDAGSLVAVAARPTDFILPPLPNSLFQRDPAAWLYDGLCLNPLFWHARRLETVNQALIYRYHPMFADAGIRFWYPPQGDDTRLDEEDFGRASVEGGDMMPIGRGTVAIGISERSTAHMVEKLALTLFEGGGAERVIAVTIPPSRTYMHLDTVFTFLDVDKATAFMPVMEGATAYSLRPGDRTESLDVHPERSVFAAFEDALGISSLDVVPTGGDDVQQAREQYGSANNFLALEPGVVVGYHRNQWTNARIAEHGVEVLEIEGFELGKGRGGARCMTCPTRRDGI